jgi:hypothetical protein
MISRARSMFVGASLTLGVLWTAAGFLRWAFGIAVTLPLFPPVDLERVQVVPSIAIGLALFALGGWLGRSTRATTLVARAESSEPERLARTPLPRELPEPAHWEQEGVAPRASADPIRRSGPGA